MSSPVIVGVDGSGRSLRALLWAAHEASLRHAPLEIIHTLPRYEVDFPLFPPGRFEFAEQHSRAIVDEAVAMVRQAYPDVECSTDFPMRAPARALVEESGRAAVIVLGNKGRNVSNLVLGSAALQVVGHARCPVVIVGHVSAGHGRIAVGTDGSQNSAPALAYAFEQAQLRGSDLQVISALGLPPEWLSTTLFPVPEDNHEVDARRQEVEELLAPLREQYPDVTVTLDVHRVDPLRALDTAGNQADLLVLGSRGRGGFHGLAVGSTTHKMMNFVSCPLAVVRSEPADSQ